MKERKMLYKKPKEKIQKIITEISVDNISKGLKGEIGYLQMDKYYYALYNKSEMKNKIHYNMTVAVNTEDGIKHQKLYGNFMFVKLNKRGEIVNLNLKDIYNITIKHCYATS